MDPIKFSIREPIKIVVTVFVILLFGFIGLYRMPYQLSPNLTVPQITVTTYWGGATPYEIEREVIEEQEKVLKGIPGLVEMESSSSNDRGNISLKFSLGTDIDDACLQVSNKLNEVRSYPENVEKPVINATGESTSPSVWLFLESAEDNPRSVYEYRSYFEDEIRQYLERIEGVAELFVGGGSRKEIHIIADPERLAAHGLTIGKLISLLQSENVNVSAGNLGVGRRDYRIRTVADYQSIAEIENTIIRSKGPKRIYLKDVASVIEGYKKRTGAVFHNGREGTGVGVKPEQGTNILAMTDRVEKVVTWLNETKLKEKGLYLRWTYDERPYINGAISLVRKNILMGGVLAIFVLLIFLRSLRSTIIVATSIPISVVGTFIFLHLFGRTLNVVSLAGISFAVGMLLDNAIVVLENIDRHRGMDKTPSEYTYHGAKEVWGAILASSLTTVAVFLPVVFMQEEAGQLFRDIAIAVTCAIILSLFVSVSVIPTFANKMFGASSGRRVSKGNRITDLGKRLGEGLMSLVAEATMTWKSRVVTIVTLTLVSVLGTAFLLPKMEYLPQGNRNFIMNILVPPPGLSLKEKTEMGENIYETLKPHMNSDREGLPGIKSLFYIGHSTVNILGVMSTHEDRAGELLPLLKKTLNSIPGTFGVSNQAGIFQTRMGGGRTIDVNLSGGRIEDLVRSAGAMMLKIKDEIPGSQVRPRPSLEIIYPEINIEPDRDRLRAVNMTPRDLGINLDVLMDGRDIGDFKREGEKKIDFILKGAEGDFATPEDLYGALVATPGGKVIPVSSLSKLRQTTGATQIRHLERQRTISLQVTPPKEVSLEEAMDRITEEFIPALGKEGLLNDVSATLSGEAGKLTQARRSLQWNFLLAAVIIYLLMAGLFNNFIYPLIILFTLPLASAGGFMGLKLVNLFTAQPLDILTMLGFVILIGVVVNNAILIVHQALNNVRYGRMTPREAVLESTRTRLRPIYMTTFTSIFGMLPLVVSPGPGSEIYRGLGSVILGGLAASSFFVIFMIPCLLMFFIGMEKPLRED